METVQQIVEFPVTALKTFSFTTGEHYRIVPSLYPDRFIGVGEITVTEYDRNCEPVQHREYHEILLKPHPHIDGWFETTFEA